MTLDEMLRARADVSPLSATLVFDVSAGVDVVLARSEIVTLSDLTHKRIGFDPDALGALVFEKLMDMAKLPASHVVQLNIPPDRQLPSWRNNNVDAVITYEPLTSALLREGVNPLAARRRLAGAPFPSLTANRSYLSHGESRLAQAAATLSQLMVRRGLLGQDINLEHRVLPEGPPDAIG